MIITKVSKNNKIDFSQIKPGQFFINHFSGHLWLKINDSSSYNCFDFTTENLNGYALNSPHKFEVVKVTEITYES